MNCLFLMDPLESIVATKDTTLALMVGASRRGHTVYFLPDIGLVWKKNKLHFHVRKVTPQLNTERPFIDHGQEILSQDDVQLIFIRTDPPFDEKYLQNTWLLDLLPPTVQVLNTASGVRTANEKIWAAQFTTIVPKTLIAARQQELMEFLNDEKDIIAKPTNSYGGQSVFHITSDGPNVNVILETLTENWRREIILQKFIPESQEGDKRILLLNGDPLGAVLRYHAHNDHRNNFLAGGKPLAAEITERDREIISVIAPKLQKLGLYFVGIDVLGDYLIEVNVTSPTCLQEMNRLYNRHLEDDVIGFAERLVLSSASRKTP